MRVRLLCFCGTTTTLSSSPFSHPNPLSLSLPSLNTFHFDDSSHRYLNRLILDLSLSVIPRSALRASSSSSCHRHRHRRNAFVSHHTLGSPTRRWPANKVRHFFFLRVSYRSLEGSHTLAIGSHIVFTQPRATLSEPPTALQSSYTATSMG